MIRDRLRELQVRLAADKPTPLATLGRVLFIGFMVFTWMAGLVYVVWPLARQVAVHVQVHIIEAVQRWIWAEPVYGGMFAAVANLTLLVMLVYLLRHWLLLAVLLVGDRIAALRPKRQRPHVARKPGTDTAVVAG